MTDADNMVISASQLDAFLDCNRRWWFEKVLRMPLPQKGYFTFGTVLHGCVERWMAADRQGRVPSPVPECLVGQVAGAPVEVFPAGWETVTDHGRPASVTPNEADLIRRVFAQAVERGIIWRGDLTSVEREINLPVIEGVDLTGFLDIHIAQEPNAVAGEYPEIHDHKSFGQSSLRYLKQPGPLDKDGRPIEIDAPYVEGDGTSPNSVGHNQQLLTYAAATSRIDGYDGPVRVRHNQFPKFADPKGVRQVEAIVSSKRLAQHWAFVQDAARRMLVVRKIKEWTDTPGPESTDSCSRYGGCAFQRICGKSETIEGYRSRIENQTIGQAASARPNLSLEPKRTKKQRAGGSVMSDGKVDIFARVKAQQAARGGAPAAPAAPAAKAAPVPAPKPAPSPAAPAINSGPVAVQPQVAGGAPWSSPGCPSCKGLGVGKTGRACPICDKVAPRNNRPTSEMYALDVVDGMVVAVARPECLARIQELGGAEGWTQGDATVVAQAPAPAPVVPAKTAVAPAAPAPAPKPPKAAKPKPAPVAPPAPAPAAEEPAAPSTVEELVSGKQPVVQITTADSSKPAKVGAGRPKVGVCIFLGCIQLDGPGRPMRMAQAVLEEVGAQLATEMGAPSYWALDPTKRKERIKQAGEKIAEGLGRVSIVFPAATNDFDLIALANALIPHADLVVEALK